MIQPQHKITKEITMRGFNFLLRVCALFYPVKKNRVLFIRKSFSGSNITPVYEKFTADYPRIDSKIIDYEGRDITKVFASRKNFSLILSSRMIVTTHGSVFKTRKNITLELWHAFPTKQDGLYRNKDDNRMFLKYTDFHSSYSDFGTLLLNARIGMPISKYIVTGAPRNDYLSQQMDDQSYGAFQKVLSYAPTYREGSVPLQQPPTIFDFEDFSLEDFKEFLRSNNYLFIWKLHPNDEKKIRFPLSLQDFPNILLLTDESLRASDKDFYQILALTDLLITDYSSVYIDYLLTDKPIVFTPTDLDHYRAERGLLLNPYDYWHPGPICLNQKELYENINNCLGDKKYFLKERMQLKNLFHTFQDGSSTDRVVNFILSKMGTYTK